MRASPSTVFGGLALLVAFASASPTLRRRSVNAPSEIFPRSDGLDESEDSPGNATSNALRRLAARAEQKDAGWALAYLSAKQKHPADTETYYYDPDGGDGVDVYVMDSGIAKLEDFGGRVTDYYKASDDLSYDDTFGHGTAVASIIGSKTYGVAKKVNLINVKMSSQNPIPFSAPAPALKKIIERHNERKTESGFKGSIVNMSWGTEDEYSGLEEQIKIAYDAGITMVAAAGNHDTNAEDTTPCNSKYVICVAAIDQNYRRAEFSYGGHDDASNYGGDVTVLAPGQMVNVLSVEGKQEQKSGTSVATPYPVGILALIYGYEGPNLTPRQARQRLLQNADENYAEGAWYETPNLLANTGYQKAPRGLPYVGAPAEACKTTYKFILDSFIINLSDFPNGDFNCDSLKKQVGGCGDLKKWKCHTATDAPYTYAASGTLPIGLEHKGCIARAIHSAGGPDFASSCSGTA